jgi:hypothetical protein
MAAPQRFSFDAAVRLLTFHRRRPDPAGAARFTSVAGSSYAAAEVTDVQAAAGASPPRATVGLIGLTGPVGVLPRRYSDAVVADQRSRSFSLTDFLDLISHRMVAAFAAAGAKYRPHRAADVGVLAPGRQRADPVAEVLLFHHAQGLTPGVRAFADEPSCIEGIRQLLAFLPANNTENPPVLATQDRADDHCRGQSSVSGLARSSGLSAENLLNHFFTPEMVYSRVPLASPRKRQVWEAYQRATQKSVSPLQQCTEKHIRLRRRPQTLSQHSGAAFAKA